MSIPLERTSPLPLYHQIANVIRSQIDLHAWETGERLPAESALAVSFGVSPLTIRQALALLVQEGRLRRQQGRGTFVTEQNETVAKVRLTAPFEEMMASIPGETVQTLDVQRVRGPSGILSLLGIPAGGEMVRVRRIRSRGNQPLSYAIGYIPPALAASLHPEDLSTKPLLIDTLEQKAGVLFREVNQTIDASLANDETATALQVPLGSPVLLVQRRYELESGKCGFVAVDYYPSPSVRYEIRLVREDRSRRDWQIRTDLGRASSDAT